MLGSAAAAAGAEVAVDRGPADPEGHGDRRNRVLPGAVHLLGHLGFVGGHDRGAAAVAAPGPSSRQSSGGALADQVAFELGQGGEHVEDELAAGGGGVDRLLEAAEPDAALGQSSDGVDQMPQGATEAV